MTKRERLYHSLVKSGNLLGYKLSKKKIKYRGKASGFYIDLAVLRSCTEENGMTVPQMLDLYFNQNIIFGKTAN